MSPFRRHCFLGVLCLSGSVVASAATNSSDSGAGSLRAAMFSAANGDIIEFALASATITVNSELAANDKGLY